MAATLATIILLAYAFAYSLAPSSAQSLVIPARQEAIDELYMYFHKLAHCIKVLGYGEPSPDCTAYGANYTNLVMNHTEKWNPEGMQSEIIPRDGYLKFVSEPFNGSITFTNLTLTLCLEGGADITVNLTIIDPEGYVVSWHIEEVSTTAAGCYSWGIDVPDVELPEGARILLTMNASQDVWLDFDDPSYPSGITFEAPAYMYDEGISTYNKDGYKQTTFATSWDASHRRVVVIGNVSNMVGLDDIQKVVVEIIDPGGTTVASCTYEWGTAQTPADYYEAYDMYDGTGTGALDFFRYNCTWDYPETATLGTYTVRITAYNTHGDTIVSENYFDMAETAPYVPEFPQYMLTIAPLVAVVSIIVFLEYRRKKCSVPAE